MPIRLSSKGRQRFGEWTAGSLRLAAGGVFGVVVLPNFLERQLPLWVTGTAFLIGSGLAIVGVIIYYWTAERVGEADMPSRESGFDDVA